jgi:hypothetical protein
LSFFVRHKIQFSVASCRFSGADADSGLCTNVRT